MQKVYTFAELNKCVTVTMIKYKCIRFHSACTKSPHET